MHPKEQTETAEAISIVHPDGVCVWIHRTEELESENSLMVAGKMAHYDMVKTFTTKDTVGSAKRGRGEAKNKEREGVRVCVPLSFAFFTGCLSRLL